ncbi:hypothetical protein Tco_1114736 [Tanacetum coccineum]
MNYYRPPLVELAVLALQRVPAVLSPVPVKWSPIPVKWYGQMSVMLQSLPASCGLPVASLKSQPDSYGQLPAIVKSLPADPSLHL